MAIASSMQWEIDAASGNDANGGGFDDTSGTPGTNYAWGAGQTTIAYADLKTDGASLNVMVSAARNFVAADVGNVLNITGGTHATTGRYQILSVASNKATVDRNWATEDNSDHADGAGTLGGAMAGIVAAFIQAATTPMVAGNKLWLKYNAAPYALPSAITVGVAGTAVLPVLFSGYYAAHGDNPTISSGQQPTIAHTTYNLSLATFWKKCFITHTVATTSATYGVTLSTSAVDECSKILHSSSGRAWSGGANTKILGCELTGIGSGTIGILSGTGGIVRNCYVHDCKFSTCAIQASGANAQIERNVIETCNVAIALADSAGIVVSENTILNCVTGISAATAGPVLIENNIIAYCGTGILWTTQTDSNLFVNNNIYGCATPTSGIATTGTWAPIGGTTNDPAFITAIATGTTATTNSAPGTTFTATGLLAGVSTSDYLCVWSGTGATAGVYAISSVAGAPDSITLATSPGASASAIKWGIVKGGTTTDLSLSSTSACIDAGYGLAAGLGVQVASKPSQGAWEIGQPTVPAAADTRYGVTRGYAGDVAGALEIPNSSSPTGTQDATSDACVVSGKKYGSPQRTGSATSGTAPAVTIGGRVARRA